ncbi:hypothetical protein 031MP004_78 [Bacillus phage 031MP004]|nr:hypothetical protein 022DV001_77 [Bacillus phage 022DV001]QFG05479.1 hypothetical protein 031MP003_80 [Bacillus phage 031MP003]QFG05568.1 hypothetical protein 031MP002_79 [Bacillus phage 031MP002]QFG05655.1 hypothetical protein 031MP004_78 [Bacillus phage 031MP004]QFG05827.1 hypothetical protein 055SW001_77 [Bacillus phage 055SW001]
MNKFSADNSLVIRETRTGQESVTSLPQAAEEIYMSGDTKLDPAQIMKKLRAEFTISTRFANYEYVPSTVSDKNEQETANI